MRAAVAVRSLAFAALAMLGGCGGGGDASTTVTSTPPVTVNVVPVVLDYGPVDTAGSTQQPIGTVNTPFVSITLCVHGTGSCQTIDHITVDTGSSGLRIIASALSGSLAAALAPVLDAQGNPLAECLPFADGYSWGPVRQADLTVGGETATGLSIQVIGDTGYASVPTSCSSGGAKAENTVTSFGGNGILGIAAFQQDCGSVCAQTAAPQLYFGCPTPASCTSTTVPLQNQVWNPVALFAVDNNGTLLALDPVPAAGAISGSGSLIFGIDTRTNNVLGSAGVLTLNANTGDLTVRVNGQTLANSFIDSGSNAYFFDDAAISACTKSNETGFYCPAATQSLTATLTGGGNVSSTLDFSIANADTLFRNGNGNYWVFNDLGGTAIPGGGFDVGLPFFLGRRVFTALEHLTTSAGPGPFVAW